ncbi:MAG: MiaB/RimO family radical SAM methylthiotransferase [Candidatus Dormibacteria bacterium]|jgi:threonylcarbamoyladenosine tRNA methylthiotransferase MtaB
MGAEPRTARGGAIAGPLRVALTTLGCKVNYAEMAELAGRLAGIGCDVVPEDEPADVRVLNSCAVTYQADATTRQRLRRLRRRDPGCHLILTGCSVDANPDWYLAAGIDGNPAVPGLDAVFANTEKLRIADHVAALAAGRGDPFRHLPPAGLRSRAFLKVQDGCDHRCTYCVVWRTRGASASVPEEVVMARAQAAVAAGHAEVILTGVDLGSYGQDRGSDLTGLVHRLLEGLDGTVRLRLSSINANDIPERLVELNGDPRLCSHWHIPLQSGSDQVLRAMHRGHRRDRYLRVVEGLRRQDPDTELTTDVMVGFPGESQEDHEATLRLIDEVEFLGCHVFRYSPRPHTEAARLPQQAGDATLRSRSAEVRRVAAASARSRRQRAVGHKHRVVWDRVTPGEAHGLTGGYHEMVADPVPGTRTGGIQTVLATSVEGDRLRGAILPELGTDEP